MNFYRKLKGYILLVLSMGFTVCAPLASGSSDFSGAANIGYLLSGDLTGIDIVANGNYVLDSSANSGDWAVSPPVFGQNNSGGEFSLSGNVNIGELHSSYLADFELSFTNNSSQSHIFGLSLNYVLNAIAGGEFASSQVQISYGDSGYDEASAYLFNNQQNVTQQSVSDVYSYNLAQGDAATFSIHVAITGDLVGTTAATVPLPAAAWTFLAGLIGLLGIAKKQGLCGKR